MDKTLNRGKGILIPLKEKLVELKLIGEENGV